MSKDLIKNVVVAVNGSQSSIHAAMYAIILAKTEHYNLKFVYVVDTGTIKRLTLSHFLVPEESSMYEKNLQEDGRKYLEYVQNLASQKGVKSITELRQGSVCLEVVNCIRETKADVLFIGGEHSVTKDSVRNDTTVHPISLFNREIIASAPCSVLVVKKPDIEFVFKQL